MDEEKEDNKSIYKKISNAIYADEIILKIVSQLRLSEKLS